MNSKKKTVTIALVVLCFALIAGGTSAFFTAVSRETNVITTASVDIALHETKLVDGTEYPYEGVVEVMPGQAVSKIVRVENTGSSSAYVRVCVDKRIVLAGDENGVPDTGLIDVRFNETDWTYRDGFYYYCEALAPGECTAALFETVVFDPAMPNMYQNSTAFIDVTAYAVQTKNNDETGPLGAKGWPEPL